MTSLKTYMNLKRGQMQKLKQDETITHKNLPYVLVSANTDVPIYWEDERFNNRLLAFQSREEANKCNEEDHGGIYRVKRMTLV